MCLGTVGAFGFILSGFEEAAEEGDEEADGLALEDPDATGNAVAVDDAFVLEAEGARSGAIDEGGAATCVDAARTGGAAVGSIAALDAAWPGASTGLISMTAI